MSVQKLVVPLQSEINKMVSFFDSVAQLVEQLTLNQWVEGSSPSGVTQKSVNELFISELADFCFLTLCINNCILWAVFGPFLSKILGKTKYLPRRFLLESHIKKELSLKREIGRQIGWKFLIVHIDSGRSAGVLGQQHCAP